MLPWKRKAYGVTPRVATVSTEYIIPDTEDRARCYSFNYKPFLGFFYTILCSTFILLSSVIVKKLTYVSPGQLSLIRNIGVAAGCLPIAVCKAKYVLGPRKLWAMLLVRSFLGASALYLNMIAYRFLPLAVASVIMSSLPALVMIMAFFYLKEPCGVIPSMSILVTLSGVLLSIRLPEVLNSTNSLSVTNPNYLIGLGCALSCIVILSVTFVTLRKMLDIHFSVIMLYFGVLGAIENAVLVYFFSSYSLPRCGWDAVNMMMMGVLGFLGHSALTLAIQVEQAGIVSIIKSSADIVLSLVLQVIFFDLDPDIYNLGGAALVLFSVSVLGTRQWLKTLPEESRKRQRLRYLLF